MRRFLQTFGLFTAMALLFSSCASILNSKQQEVKIKSADEAEVYVNGDKLGKGPVVKTNLTRDKNVKQVKVEQKGYKPEYDVFLQHKRPALYILSWVPFGVFALIPPYNDNGKKAFDYVDEKTITPETPFNQRKQDEKYMFLKNTSFDVSREDLNYRFYEYEDFKKGKGPASVNKSEEDVKVNNTQFTEALNNVLYSNGYIDTTSRIFRDKSNTLYVSANVKEIDVNFLNSDFTSELKVGTVVQTEATIEWEIYNVYEQMQIKKKIDSRSDLIATNYYDEHMHKSVEDAIFTSFSKLLDDSEVKKLTEVEDQKTANFQTKNDLLKPSTPSNLTEAKTATVTIKSEKGHGSGCVISKNGHIVTNYHVIAGQSDYKVILNNNKKLDAKLVRKNEYADLVLLKVDHTFNTAYTLPVEENYKIGETIYAIGTPSSIELGQTLSKGIISGIREHEDRTFIQSDVSVSGGNSGGAMVSEDGDLIGIVSSKVVGYSVEGINFSIPAYQINELLGLDYQ